MRLLTGVAESMRTLVFTPDLMMFRINLILFPLVCGSLIALNVWVVKSINAMTTSIAVLETQGANYGTSSYTKSDALAAEYRMKNEIQRDMEQRYPPVWLRELAKENAVRIKSLEMLIKDAKPAD